MRGRLEGEIAVLQEKIRSIRGNEAHLRSRRETLTGEINARNQDREKLLSERAGIDARLLELSLERDSSAGKLRAVQEQITGLNACLLYTSEQAGYGSAVRAFLGMRIPDLECGEQSVHVCEFLTAGMDCRERKEDSDTMKLWKKCPLLVLIAVSGLILELIGLANQNGIYADYRPDGPETPAMACLLYTSRCV